MILKIIYFTSSMKNNKLNPIKPGIIILNLKTTYSQIS